MQVAAPTSWWRHRRGVPHYVWVGFLLLGLLAALYWVSKPAAVHGVHNITTAIAFVPDSVQSALKQVNLPHVLDDEDSVWHDRVDYELAWPEAFSYADAESSRLGLLLPRAGPVFGCF